MKLNYSEPKIYTGGVDISMWGKLSSKEKRKALQKEWFVYYSYRDPKTGKLKRQPHIKAGANKLKTKQKRYAFLRTLQRALLELLDYGFNPYQDNSELEKDFYREEFQLKEKSKTSKETKEEKNIKHTVLDDNDEITIAEAIERGMEIKEQVMSKDSFVRYKSRINRFYLWLEAKKYQNRPISIIDKKVIITYLNEELTRTSPRSRNNTRTDISSLFQVLEDNEIIKTNFIRKIPVIKSTPVRHKTYTPSQEKLIYKRLAEEDSELFLFVEFINYGFLRPIEICRLKIEDVDISDKKLYVKAKNKPVKIKILPEILINRLPDFKEKNPKSYLFGKTGFGEEWEVSATQKRDFFSKRFKKIKDDLGLGKEYGLYSFRHTSITKLYNEFRKEMSTHDAKSKLLPITGHATMKALEKYLRDIDAELPKDFSKYLNSRAD